jgi:hypothetical protein
LGRGGHAVEHFPLLVIYLGTFQQIYHANDGIQRRSQLVANGAYKLTLGEIGAIGLIQRSEQATNK